jgi:hypothetical protein
MKKRHMCSAAILEKIFNMAAYGVPALLLSNRFRYRWVDASDEKRHVC